MYKSLHLSITFLFLLSFIKSVYSQNFTWVKGTTQSTQPGIYGTIGTTAITNNPGGRENPINWKDANGNFWIFGGEGHDFNTNNGYLNDLWRYNPVTNVWTWIKGTTTINQLGVYGTLGVSSASNNPGSRIGSVSWTDQNGNLWLFGGYGFASLPGQGHLNDLWRYSIANNEWTWMGGGNTIYQPAVYGTLGVASPSNIPGARVGAKCWSDNSTQMWMLGGLGVNNNSLTLGALNDLWKFDMSTYQWTWMHGTGAVNTSGVYGTQAVSSPVNMPGGRQWAMGWSDFTNSALWLFGGDGIGNPTNPTQGPLNDIWKYDLNINEWVWVNGSNTINQTGNYSTFGVPTAFSRPGARSNGVTWLDGANNFWLFSGTGIATNTSTVGHLNDLWKYSKTTNQWTWIKGNNALNQNGTYGSQGVSAPSNVPGARYGSANWMDANNNLWFFGGNGFPAAGNNGKLNDMWRYQNCFISPITMSISTAYENICAGEATSLTVIGSNSYTWNTGSNQSFIVISPSVTTAYSVSTTGINNCIYTAGFTQSVSLCSGLSLFDSDEKFSIYPNPSNGTLFIGKTSSTGDVTITLSDNTGRVVYEKKLVTRDEKIETGLVNGIYFYKIKTSEESFEGKLMIHY